MWSGTAFRWKGPGVRVGDSERDLKALGGCLRPAGAAVNPVSLPLLQRRGGSVGGRRLLWERGVRLWRDPQKGFCARETWQMSLSTFLNHDFKPQLSQLQNGAGSPSLWLLESISTKVRVKALSWMKGRAWLSERGLQGRGSHYFLTRPPLTGRLPAEAWQKRVPEPAARAGSLQPWGATPLKASVLHSQNPSKGHLCAVVAAFGGRSRCHR